MSTENNFNNMPKGGRLVFGIFMVIVYVAVGLLFILTYSILIITSSVLSSELSYASMASGEATGSIGGCDAALASHLKMAQAYRHIYPDIKTELYEITQIHNIVTVPDGYSHGGSELHSCEKG